MGATRAPPACGDGRVPAVAVRIDLTGNLRIEAGDKVLERAAELLTEAVAGYRAIGMPRHEAMAQRVLAPLR